MGPYQSGGNLLRRVLLTNGLLSAFTGLICLLLPGLVSAAIFEKNFVLWGLGPEENIFELVVIITLFVLACCIGQLVRLRPCVCQYLSKHSMLPASGSRIFIPTH
jgi:hypothetical protein